MAEGKSLEDLMKKVADELDDVPTSSQTNIMINPGDMSLEDLMKNVVGKLDELPPPKPIGQPLENVQELSGMENLVNRVAENLDKQAESDCAGGDNNVKANDTLEDMLRTLNRNIKSGDWLTQNTAEKWVSENPKLAKEYKKAADLYKDS